MIMRIRGTDKKSGTGGGLMAPESSEGLWKWLGVEGDEGGTMNSRRGSEVFRRDGEREGKGSWKTAPEHFGLLLHPEKIVGGDTRNWEARARRRGEWCVCHCRDGKHSTPGKEAPPPGGARQGGMWEAQRQFFLTRFWPSWEFSNDWEIRTWCLMLALRGKKGGGVRAAALRKCVPSMSVWRRH